MKKNIDWRMQLSVVLTILGAIYYLFFLFYICAGMRIDRIHDHLTDGWPPVLADVIPYVSPIFICLGLLFGSSYGKKRKTKVGSNNEVLAKPLAGNDGLK